MKRPLFLKVPWNQVLCASLVALLASQCESPDSTSPEPLKDGCFIESVVDGELPSAMRSPSFNTRQDIPVGDQVSISALADLNKDGKLDVVVQDRGSSAYGTLRVLLGKGGGLFGPVLTVPTKLTDRILVRDVTGDGKVDLATLDTLTNEVLVLPGLGDGTLGAPLRSKVASQSHRIQLMDLNIDGKLDAVVASWAPYDGTPSPPGGQLSVLLGNGDGTFRPSSIFMINTQPDFLTEGDWNQDGRPDLVLGGGNSYAVSVRLGNGDGTFQPPQDVVGGSFASAVAADFDRDGKQDLATTGQTSGKVSVFLGSGDGTFLPAREISVDGTQLGTQDVNADGNVDLVVFGGYSVRVLLGKGDGTFLAPLLTRSGGAAFGDMNADGNLDLVGAFGGSVGVQFGRGDGTFQGPQNLPLSTSPVGLLLDDVNRDGKLDLFISGAEGAQVELRLGKGNGDFEMPQIVDPFAGPRSMTIGDVDSDGLADLLLTNAGDLRGYGAHYDLTGDLRVFSGNGDGTFKPAKYVLQYTLLAGMGTVDLNRDGKLDLAVIQRSPGADSKLLVLLGNGDGSFTTGQKEPLTGYHNVMVTDMNADGLKDLVLGQGNGSEITTLLGKGDGTLHPPVRSFISPCELHQQVLGDVNGDGTPDLAVTYRSDRKYAGIALGRKDGSFSALAQVNLGQSAIGVALKDINGDGKLDLIVTFELSAAVFVGQGNGRFYQPLHFGTDRNDGAMAFGDIDADGKLDALVGNGGDRPSVSVLLNQTR